MDRRPNHRKARDCARVAPRGLPKVLAVALPELLWSAQSGGADQETHLANDRGNAGWGAPKILGELLKLGFVVSERTAGRYLRRLRRRGDPAKRWLAFLNNYREAIVAFDFFTVPTVSFQLLYCFFVIELAETHSIVRRTNLDSGRDR